MYLQQDMAVPIYDPMNAPHMSGVQPVAIPRPQVGIERLPTRRMSDEPRESMNCKSCRKRKIKCNRLRPACEACQVFQCPCIYDAVPKKRGPKTDVLEALLKRVDGLEAKLREKNDGDASPTTSEQSTTVAGQESVSAPQDGQASEPAAKRIALDTSQSSLVAEADDAAISPRTPASTDLSSSPVRTDALLDTYFSRFHGKPFYILDESSIRQRLQLKQLPQFLCDAISAVAARYTPNPNGHQAAIKLSEDFAARSRKEISIDEPSIDALQALLLLANAFIALGWGKKSYMLMTSAIGMAMALEIHREMEPQARMTPVEREMRRRLFWTCYLLDHYQTTGSKRPSLISDSSIFLRLPSWSPSPPSLPIEGEFFQSGSNLQSFQGSGKKPQGSNGMLIDITRILGAANRYIAAGGVKGDSHFPWHSLSALSKIRNELDIWASGTDEIFASLNTLFGQVDSTILVLSKLIYHLIFCLIYRPFLPIDIAELAEIGQHQSWQIEATNLCFLHANAIAELVDYWKQTSSTEWPAFVGFCICTAGIVHIHGAHYSKQGGNAELNVFSSSSEFLTREMQHLSDLGYIWAGAQHQRDTLQSIYNAHGELAKTLARNQMRYNPGFNSEDFFDRYLNTGGLGGQPFNFNAANLNMADIKVNLGADSTAHGMLASRPAEMLERIGNKRKNSVQAARKRPEVRVISTLPPSVSGLPTPALPRRSFSFTAGVMPRGSPGLLTTPTSLPPPQENDECRSEGMREHMHEATAAAAGFVMSPVAQNTSAQAFSAMGGAPFTPPYNFAPGHTATNGCAGLMTEVNEGYDAMFGSVSSNTFSSPAPWQNDDHIAKVGHGANAATVASPDTKSNNGSVATAQGEEKDPFLTLLEQLAENEHRAHGNGQGNDLDFFLAGHSAGP